MGQGRRRVVFEYEGDAAPELIGIAAQLLGIALGIPIARKIQRSTPVDPPTSAALRVLGLRPDRLPKLAALKAARNRAIQAHHPDRGGDTAAAAKINTAYRLVADRLQPHS